MKSLSFTVIIFSMIYCGLTFAGIDRATVIRPIENGITSTFFVPWLRSASPAAEIAKLAI